jgi:hypothetical protein
MVVGAAGAAQTPKIGDFQPAQKPCMKNQLYQIPYRIVDRGSKRADPS